MKKLKMEYDEESYWPVLIIKEGRPYLLTKLVRKDVNDPCTLCDLRAECHDVGSASNYVSLCLADDRDDAWYFVEDWNIVDKLVADFVTDVATYK